MEEGNLTCRFSSQIDVIFILKCFVFFYLQEEQERIQEALKEKEEQIKETLAKERRELERQIEEEKRKNAIERERRRFVKYL